MITAKPYHQGRPRLRDIQQRELEYNTLYIENKIR